jgi:prepilin-type N-terminal cleavage/methylation domain-containing protein
MRSGDQARGDGRRGWSLLEVLAAIVVVGIGVTLFVKVHKMSRQGSTSSNKVMMAGKMIEKHLEDTRILIAKDTTANWPPRSRTIAAMAPHNISLEAVIGPAYSPKDGALVQNVVRMDLTARWTRPVRDSLKVTTYVAKRF